MAANAPKIPVRAFNTKNIEEAITALTDEAIEQRDAEIRKHALGKEDYVGAKRELPIGTVIARNYEVLKRICGGRRHGNTFMYLCSYQNKIATVKLAKEEVEDIKDPTFFTVFRELLVWKELDKFLPMLYLNPPLVDSKLDPRALSYKALSFNFEQLLDRFTVLPIGLCLLAAADLLCAIKSLHDCGFVHSDIRPRHFCLGLAEGGTHTNIVYLVDMSRAQRFVSFDPDAELPSIDFDPDPLYASTEVLHGKQATRRDDLLSWLYSLLAFRTSNFWRKYSGEQLNQVKDTLEEDKLVVGYGPVVGPIIAAILYYLRRLSPACRKPDYEFLMQCIVTGLKAHCDGSVPPSLPEKLLHFWKLHQYKSDMDESEAFASRMKIMRQESCFSYMDENPEKVLPVSMQDKINHWFQLLTQEAHMKMFKVIEEKVKPPESFPSILDKNDMATKTKCESEIKEDDLKEGPYVKMLPIRLEGGGKPDERYKRRIKKRSHSRH